MSQRNVVNLRVFPSRGVCVCVWNYASQVTCLQIRIFSFPHFIPLSVHTSFQLDRANHCAGRMYTSREWVSTLLHGRAL